MRMATIGVNGLPARFRRVAGLSWYALKVTRTKSWESARAGPARSATMRLSRRPTGRVGLYRPMGRIVRSAACPAPTY
jgi:hypothetical protein